MMKQKIRMAITKAFIAVEGSNAVASDRIFQEVQELTRQITSVFKKRLPSGGTLHIEEVQDQVELALMRNGQYPVARAYVLYREERRKAREVELQKEAQERNVPLITMPDGELKPLDTVRVATIVDEACRGLSDVNAQPIITEALRNLYNQAKLNDVHKALIMAARTMIEKEPNYTYVSARLLMDSLRAEALQHLQVKMEATFDEMTGLYLRILSATSNMASTKNARSTIG